MKSYNLVIMYIESPSFVRRRILSIPHQRQSSEQGMIFGKQREQLTNHVYQALGKHGKDEQILQRFRKQAEQRKRQKFQAKRRPQNLSLLAPTMIHEPAPLTLNTSALNQTPLLQIRTEQSPAPSQLSERPEVADMLRHSNDLVDRYKQLLSVKERELKRRDRKIQNGKRAMEKMELRIRELKRERQLVEREQQLEMSKIEETLKQMNTHIANNKSSLTRQISVLHQELKPTFSEQLSSTKQKQRPSYIFPLQEGLQTPKKPQKQMLQNIKKKAQSLKHTERINEIEVRHNPSVVYMKTNRSPKAYDGQEGSMISRFPLRRTIFMGEEN